VPLQDFTLDFRRDQEEEEDHQAFVYPQNQGLLDHQRADPNRHQRVVDQLVGRSQRRIHHGERRQHGGDSQRPRSLPGLL
jgi:hypothetical protein